MRSHQLVSVVVVVLLAIILWFVWPRSVEHYMDGNAWKITVTESDGSSDSGTYYFKGKKAYEVDDGIADRDNSVDIQYSGSKDFVLDDTDSHVDNKSSDSITGTATDDDEAASFKMVPVKNVVFPKDKKLTAKQVKKQVNITQVTFNKAAKDLLDENSKKDTIISYKKGSAKDIELVGEGTALSDWEYKDKKINTVYNNENQKISPDTTSSIKISLNDIEKYMSPDDIEKAVQKAMKNGGDEVDVNSIGSAKADFNSTKDKKGKGVRIHYKMGYSKLTPETKKLSYLANGGKPKFKKIVAGINLDRTDVDPDDLGLGTSRSAYYEITFEDGKIKARQPGY